MTYEHKTDRINSQLYVESYIKENLIYKYGSTIFSIKIKNNKTDQKSFFSLSPKGRKRATRVLVRSPPLVGFIPTNEKLSRVTFSFTWRFQVRFLPPALLLTQAGLVASKSPIAKVFFSIAI